jgi:crotonobetainyl-CoA:carnitine CoA-transferase CaiB-like acyl-CoA transferase
LLADRGADLEARNNRGQTPLASIVARSSRAPGAQYAGGADAGANTAELLRQLGAKP